MLNKWKPAKIPLIVYGNGMFGKDHVKLKGNRCGVAGVLWRALKKRESEGGLIAVTIQEHFTSKTCNSCHKQNLKAADGYSVLECKACGVLWQRDVNAAKDMMEIALSIWDGKGRPAAYT